MTGERQLSLGKKKYLINGGLDFFSWTARGGILGSSRVQLTCTRLQVWQERKKGGWRRGKERVLYSSPASSLIFEHKERADCATQATGQELCVRSEYSSGLPTST